MWLEWRNGQWQLDEQRLGNPVEVLFAGTSETAYRGLDGVIRNRACCKDDWTGRSFRLLEPNGHIFLPGSQRIHYETLSQRGYVKITGQEGCWPAFDVVRCQQFKNDRQAEDRVARSGELASQIIPSITEVTTPAHERGALMVRILESSPGMSVQELANKICVTTRHVYRCIEAYRVRSIPMDHQKELVEMALAHAGPDAVVNGRHYDVKTDGFISQDKGVENTVEYKPMKGNTIGYAEICKDGKVYFDTETTGR